MALTHAKVFEALVSVLNLGSIVDDGLYVTF